MAYDSKAALKKKTMKELMELRDRFSKFIYEEQHDFSVNHQFPSYLSLIELEISSRIGTKK